MRSTVGISSFRICSFSLPTTLHFFLLTRSHALCCSSVDLDATTASPMHRTCPLATGKLSIPDKHTSIQPICIYANKSLVYRIWFVEIDDASCEWPFKKWDDFWRVNENRFSVKRHRRYIRIRIDNYVLAETLYACVCLQDVKRIVERAQS